MVNTAVPCFFSIAENLGKNYRITGKVRLDIICSQLRTRKQLLVLLQESVIKQYKSEMIKKYLMQAFPFCSIFLNYGGFAISGKHTVDPRKVEADLQEGALERPEDISQSAHFLSNTRQYRGVREMPDDFVIIHNRRRRGAARQRQVIRRHVG